MFVCSFAAIVLVLPALAGAVTIFNNNNNAVTNPNEVPPNTGTTATTIDQCNTGTLQCCTQVQASDLSYVATVTEPGGVIVVGPLIYGTNCSPVTVLGTSGSSCPTQPVCCTDNRVNGEALECQPATTIGARDLAGDQLELPGDGTETGAAGNGLINELAGSSLGL